MAEINGPNANLRASPPPSLPAVQQPAIHLPAGRRRAQSCLIAFTAASNTPLTRPADHTWPPLRLGVGVSPSLFSSCQSLAPPVFAIPVESLMSLSWRGDAVLAELDTLPFDSPGDVTYGSIRTQLELSGTPIQGNYLLIAAQAMALDFTLVTDNEKEFSRIDGLRVENWLRDYIPTRLA